MKWTESYRNKNSQSWWDITKVDWYDMIRDDRPLEVQYEDVNIEYKDEAKKILIEELGFEPEYDEQLIYYEIRLRDLLRKFKSGDFTQEEFAKIRYQRGFLIRQHVWEEGGEHAHLIDPEEFKHGFKM